MDPIAPDARSGSTAPSSLELLPAKDIAALAIDVPVANRPWELTDAALMAGLEKSKGRAFIALKAPPSARVSETIRVELVRLDRAPIPRGTRAAITKDEIAEGLQAIAALGVVVREYFDALGIVDAQADPTKVGALRTDPHVDFVEPVVNDWQTSEPAPPSTRLPSGPPAAILTETIPDGVAFVGAPGAWAYTTGALAHLLIIDTGYDRGHPDLPNTPLVNCTHGMFGGCDDAQPVPHGTHATGVIMAPQNGFGLIGVAPGVTSLDTYHWGPAGRATGPATPATSCRH